MHSGILEPIYDSRQSFYGKAFVVRDCVGDDVVYKLLSYGTLVASAKVDPDGKWSYTHMGNYSQTTSRHQKEFFKQLGLSDEDINILKKNVDKEVTFE